VAEDGAAAQALDCLRALENKAVATHMETLRRRVQELEKAGDFEGAMKVAEELNALQRRKS
jgi:hypothetical protein